MLEMICPGCNKNIRIDNYLNYVFCMYCGIKIKLAHQSQAIYQSDNSVKIDELFDEIVFALENSIQSQYKELSKKIDNAYISNKRVPDEKYEIVKILLDRDQFRLISFIKKNNEITKAEENFILKSENLAKELLEFYLSITVHIENNNIHKYSCFSIKDHCYLISRISLIISKYKTLNSYIGNFVLIDSDGYNLEWAEFILKNRLSDIENTKIYTITVNEAKHYITYGGKTDIYTEKEVAFISAYAYYEKFLSHHLDLKLLVDKYYTRPESDKPSFFRKFFGI